MTMPKVSLQQQQQKQYQNAHMTTSHLDSLNTKKTMKYDIGNPGPGLGQEQTCGGGLMLM
jgi:hypothetical protein